MKIVLVNYRYFITGGPERYLFNVKDLLEKEGHTVIPFSVKHKSNFPCDYEKYFASPIGRGDITFFSESDKTSIREIRKFFSRMFFSFEVRRNFGKLVSDTNPDLVYVLHYQNKLSPSFIGTAKRRNLPVVQRVSDFGHICANQLFYNYKLNSVCEKCLEGSKLNAVLYRCVYKSALYSLIKVSALKFHEFLRITSRIDAFVIPSRFTYSKLAAFGIPERKLNHIPSFFSDSINGKNSGNHEVKYGNFAMYVGRIEEEKGMMTLARAFEGTDMNLKIIGFSGTGYDIKMKEYLKDKTHKIEFCGKQPFEVISDYLNECAFTICPTECYDNFPNSVIESFAFKKAVVCTNIGSLKEMVEHNVTGLLYETHDHKTLREYCSRLFLNKEESIKMGIAGRKWIESELSESNHYNALISLFRKLMSKNNKSQSTSE
ncbi:MAG: glycosyltransferase family 4 protein [Bacteroidota bacterium]|nr:glycosyltransferase family 4 protein [Bacteroidota bacterium]